MKHLLFLILGLTLHLATPAIAEPPQTVYVNLDPWGLGVLPVNLDAADGGEAYYSADFGLGGVSIYLSLYVGDLGQVEFYLVDDLGSYALFGGEGITDYDRMTFAYPQTVTGIFDTGVSSIAAGSDLPWVQSQYVPPVIPWSASDAFFDTALMLTGVVLRWLLVGLACAVSIQAVIHIVRLSFRRFGGKLR